MGRSDGNKGDDSYYNNSTPDYTACIYQWGSFYLAEDTQGNKLSAPVTDFFICATACNTYCAAQGGGTVRVLRGSYNITSDTVNLSAVNTIWKLKGATITRSVNYTGTSKAIFNITASGVEIHDGTLVDSVQVTNTKIIVSQPTSNIENIGIYRTIMTTPGYQAIVISATTANTISGIMIDGVIINETKNSGAGIVIGKGAGSATVQNCRIIDPGHTAIDIWGCNEYIKALNNYIDKTTNTNGIGIACTNYRDSDTETGSCKEIIISGNRFKGAIQYDNILIHGAAEKVIVQSNFMTNVSGRYGVNITFHDLDTDRYAREVLVLDNIIANTGGAGISVVSSATITFQAFKISGNSISNVIGNGIDLTSGVQNAIVSGNMIYAPGQDAAANRCGIRLRLCIDTLVYGNQIFCDSDADFSILETSDATSARNRIFDNWVNLDISTNAATTKVYQNQGWVTENKGTGSITSAATSATVTHGLNYTPDPGEITINFTENPTVASTIWYLSNIGATTFDINVAVAPGASNLDFAWSVRRI